MRYPDEILHAANIVEEMEGTEGLLLLPVTNKNTVMLQVALRSLRHDLTNIDVSSFGAQVVTDFTGKPLIYLLDTRDWPEVAEHKLLTILGVVKAGQTPEHLKSVDMPKLDKRRKRDDNG